MRRVLLVAYYFPPIGGIGSIRLLRFAEHLPEFGWDATVLAPKATPHAQDPRLAYPEARVVRARSLELSRLKRLVPRIGGSADADADADADDGRARAAARRAGRLLYPDPQIGWLPGALVAGRRAVRRTSFDAVVSSSFPITAHLVAARLSRAAALPWIAEFRDPWSDALPASYPLRRRAAALERAIATEATAVVMPTSTWADHYARVWGRPVAVVPNGHDGRLPAAPRPDVPTVTYLGSIYPERQSFARLWKAMAQVADADVPGGFKIRFIGEAPPATLADLHAAGLKATIEVTGLVSHERAVELVASSSLLFASGATTDEITGRGQIPAKLFEYLATDLPILWLGATRGDAAMLLADQPGCYLDERSDERALGEAIRAGVRGDRHARDVDRLSRRARAGLLARILADAVENRRQARAAAAAAT
jgi:glycosyltransferase involved in cell wall biosynthesis